MAHNNVLAVDADGRPFMLELWLACLHEYLRRPVRDGISLLEHTSGSLPAPTTPTAHAADVGEDVHRQYRADSVACTQWSGRDAVAQLDVRDQLTYWYQRAHFCQVTSAQTLYDVMARHYSLSESTV
ncbi:unnamed protein product [Closterium sp. NIES-54]